MGAQWTGLQRVVRAMYQLGPVRPDDTTDDDDEEEDQRGLDEAVFRRCIAMLQQRVLVNWYESPLLFFAAVLGINDAEGSWREPKHYTGSLAGLVWCRCMLMLEKAFRDRSCATMFVFDGEVILITVRNQNRAIRGLGRKVAPFCR